MNLKRILSQRSDVAWKDVDGQVILMDLGVQKRVHRLNSVGSFIWKNFNNRNTLEDILALICNEFSVDEDVAKDDLRDIVTKLVDIGVLIGP